MSHDGGACDAVENCLCLHGGGLGGGAGAENPY
jgi:hypothetical protein